MKEQIVRKILSATGAKRILETKLIQELWSGYGKILRCKLEGGKMASTVVKHVQLPKSSKHPRGWNTNLSHKRKLKSYKVEIQWYTGLAKQCSKGCRIPVLYDFNNQKEEFLMILEDLNEAGYAIRKSSVNLSEIKLCLKWLANFHACFMQVYDKNLWKIGSYWHLETRPDELEAMLDKELKSVASQIDQALNNAKYQTVIHGDAKLANFCFSKNSKKVAAVDFQYVGHGCGIKDVAYFLSSCLAETELHKYEPILLAYYFNALSTGLKKTEKSIDFQKVKEEWSILYAYAWTDFYRFLDGWSPGHWKMNTYSESMKNKVLKALN